MILSWYSAGYINKKARQHFLKSIKHQRHSISNHSHHHLWTPSRTYKEAIIQVSLKAINAFYRKLRETNKTLKGEVDKKQ